MFAFLKQKETKVQEASPQATASTLKVAFIIVYLRGSGSDSIQVPVKQDIWNNMAQTF